MSFEVRKHSQNMVKGPRRKGNENLAHNRSKKRSKTSNESSGQHLQGVELSQEIE